nr:hypothetical protein [Kangiella sp. TOML190]
MDSISKVVPILPVALVSVIYQRHQFLPLSQTAILAEAKELMLELKAKGAPVKLSETAYEGALIKALDLLTGRKLVSLKNDQYQITDKSVPILKYYANSIEQWFS